MANSYKEDEQISDVPKIKTITRLLSYLLKYKWKILIVMGLMAVGTFVSLINPLFIETGIDKYISAKNMKGFFMLMATTSALMREKCAVMDCRME